MASSLDEGVAVCRGGLFGDKENWLYGEAGKHGETSGVPGMELR